MYISAVYLKCFFNAYCTDNMSGCANKLHYIKMHRRLTKAQSHDHNKTLKVQIFKKPKIGTSIKGFYLLCLSDIICRGDKI